MARHRSRSKAEWAARDRAASRALSEIEVSQEDMDKAREEMDRVWAAKRARLAEARARRPPEEVAEADRQWDEFFDSLKQGK